jgi:hypothetical protein
MPWERPRKTKKPEKRTGNSLVEIKKSAKRTRQKLTTREQRRENRVGGSMENREKDDEKKMHTPDGDYDIGWSKRGDRRGSLVWLIALGCVLGLVFLLVTCGTQLASTTSSMLGGSGGNQSGSAYGIVDKRVQEAFSVGDEDVPGGANDDANVQTQSGGSGSGTQTQQTPQQPQQAPTGVANPALPMVESADPSAAVTPPQR